MDWFYRPIHIFYIEKNLVEDFRCYCIQGEVFMSFMYFLDKRIKPFIVKGRKYCKPENTGVLGDGISCIKEYDVNIWFYTKNNVTIAFDAGHLNYKGILKEFKKININPNDIEHVFITHIDVDHVGGIDKKGNNIFPNGKIYLGEDEEVYLLNQVYRFKYFVFKIKSGVEIRNGYTLLKDSEIVQINDIFIEIVHVPGHTKGHLCYIVDQKILVCGDCIAINENGGYSFFDFFTQDSELNKRSLKKLLRKLENKDIKKVCTGHSGIWDYSDMIFKNIEESAAFSRKAPFHTDAVGNMFK